MWNSAAATSCFPQSMSAPHNSDRVQSDQSARCTKKLELHAGGPASSGARNIGLKRCSALRLSDANLRRALQHAGLLGAPLFSSPDDMSRALCCHAAVIIFHLSLNVTSFNVCSRFHLLRLSRQYVRAACGRTPCPCPRHPETQVTRRPSTPDNPSTRPIDKE